jgi:cytidylate kinase
MNIITVSRQVGSLGDVIAAIVARKTGLKLIGRDQVHERANECDPEYSDACSVYELEKGPGFFERIFFDTPSYTSLFESLTYEFASEGNVVMVGRGSQLVLRDIPGVTRVRVVASVRIRIERIKDRFGISADEASEFVRKHDAERRALMRSIFQRDPSDWSLFDIVLNTDHYTADAASDVVCEAYARIDKAPEPTDLKAKLAAMAIGKRLETVIKKRMTPRVAYQVQVVGEPGGVMIISGRIGERAHKEKIEAIAKEYPGVTSVINELKVTQLTFSY